jgi:hypothetical protein
MKTAMLKAGVIIYIIAYVIGFIIGLIPFLPPPFSIILIIAPIALMVVRLISYLLMIMGAWTAFKTRNEKFTNKEEK